MNNPMKLPKFRLPNEITRVERAPISARVKINTKTLLEKAAKKSGVSLALFAANVLDDYADWLKKSRKRKL